MDFIIVICKVNNLVFYVMNICYVRSYKISDLMVFCSLVLHETQIRKRKFTENWLFGILGRIVWSQKNILFYVLQVKYRKIFFQWFPPTSCRSIDLCPNCAKNKICMKETWQLDVTIFFWFELHINNTCVTYSFFSWQKITVFLAAFPIISFFVTPNFNYSYSKSIQFLKFYCINFLNKIFEKINSFQRVRVITF